MEDTLPDTMATLYCVHSAVAVRDSGERINSNVIYAVCELCAASLRFEIRPQDWEIDYETEGPHLDSSHPTQPEPTNRQERD